VTTHQKLHGGVIVSYERHTHGVVELLAYRIRNRFELSYYNHPNEIDGHRRHDFVIVLSQRDLEGVVKAFRARSEPVPLIIHIDRPDIVRRINYAVQFPRVEIITIPQSDLGDPTDTLKVTLFQDIIEHLEARVR
jgi:hypothetical protein